MLFAVRLANEVYPPWEKEYINYEKLKKFLKEAVVGEQIAWTDSDETRFVTTLDQELERVHSFESAKYAELSARISAFEDKADKFSDGSATDKIDVDQFRDDMEEILELTTQLDAFSRLNYTGFTKIVKKHDRLHPNYQLKAMLRVRLNALPFHNEDYSPLLYRLSALYTFLADNFNVNAPKSASKMSLSESSNRYLSMRFWVHPENLMEVKTKILRHLPVLVYNREADEGETATNTDPKVTSLYFDNSSLEFYDAQLGKNQLSLKTSAHEDAKMVQSLRLRWYGSLEDGPSINLTFKDGSGTEILTLPLKEKHIDAFLAGDESYVHRQAAKLHKKGVLTSADSVQDYEAQLRAVQDFIREHNLGPVLRTTYFKTAFEIPGDDRVRVILDSDISYIREDAFDADRPIRDPDHWKRNDLDIPGVEDPLSTIRKSEFSKFPYAVLELRLKGVASAVSGSGSASAPASTATTPPPAWFEELVESQLIRPVPQFSKYVQGIASLFTEDERLSGLPFWLVDLDRDLRKDPVDVYKEQRSRLLKTNRGKWGRVVADETLNSANAEEVESSEDETTTTNTTSSIDNYGAIAAGGLGIPTWEHSRLEGDSEDEELVLPPGVKEPGTLLRNSGPVKVEAKVWLANERTFNKWLNVTTLLSALTFALYNSVGKAVDQRSAEIVAYIMFALTLFAGIWGYYTYTQRLHYIRMRSEKHLDNPVGPLVVAGTLTFVLLVNFYTTFKNRSTK